MDLHEYFSLNKSIVEVQLESYIKEEAEIPVIVEAMRYSLLAGGKRLRPILAIMACELFDGDIKEVLPFACGIEMIHTYSLIHDDLPAMDNDDYRRGKPTNHKVFGEGFAILAGDALLNKAFEIMHQALVKTPKLEYIKAAAYISKASGTAGMIGGQCIDLHYENKQIDSKLLNAMHDKKTGAMIKAPLVAGALIAGAKEEDVQRLEKFGQLIGLAFQISDDILDVEGSSEKLGKKTGSDASNNKSTFVSCYGLDKSKEMAKSIIKEAQNSIDLYGNKGLLLKELSNYIIERDI
ncbi:MAG: geranylgeranyl pyrophosphate synthase [Clostridia bacterium]|jgi:geranylgeranyl diphosphate synthase type II|nr:geranylgeranyl pyrophosphate synthase [Clostridia bacterium]